jgi:MFS family permease
MNYQASVTDFFKPQKWGMNMLLGAVCILIPMIGPIILNGWAITQLWSRGDDENPSEYPPFDFQYFTKYLMRGLWPFLVQMASSLIIMPIIVILMIFFMIAAPAMQNHEAIAVLMIILGIIAYFVLILALNFIIVPLSIAATITQDFVPAFNFRFVRNFLSLIWKELLITTLFLFALGIVMSIVAVCTCYIGAIALCPVILFAWQHLQKQLYLLHLARGGMILPRSQKLSDLPPILP